MESKIALLGDPHLGVELYGREQEDGLNTRVMDYFRSLDYIIDWLDSGGRGVNTLMILGDTYHVKNPKPYVQKMFIDRIKYLDKIVNEIVILGGNHDCYAYSIYSILSILEDVSDRVKVILKPGFYRLDSGLKYAAIPYYHYFNEEQLEDFSEGASTCSFGIAHVTAEGAGLRLDSPGEFIFGGDVGLPLHNFVLSGIPWYIGHIHARQNVRNNKDVRYIGSMERNDFGDEDTEKGFEVITVEDGKVVDSEFVLNPEVRSFKKLTVDSKKSYDKAKKQIKEGDVVRVNLIAEGLPQGPETFKSSLEKHIERVGAIDGGVNIIRATSELEAVETSESTEEVGVHEAFTAYLGTLGMPESKEKRLANKHKEIYVNCFS